LHHQRATPGTPNPSAVTSADIRTGHEREVAVLYEAPRIVRRERINALLSVGSITSDVNLKANIVAVDW
jgi:hypothetical protein